MNFLNLQYFLAVAQELNITKASQQLRISQQSLSNHILKLEKELGTQLFIRTPALSLTYAGRTLQKSASQMLDLKRQMVSEIEDISNNHRGELRIGISFTRGQTILPDILPRFKKTHPFVDISLMEQNSEALESALQHGLIDLMIEFTPIKLESAESIQIFKDRLFLIVPRSYMDELYGNKADDMRARFETDVDITAFKEYPFLMLKKGNKARSIMDEYFLRHGITPHILMETENTQTAFALAVQGMGIAVYPEMFLCSRHALSLPNLMSPPVDCFPLNDPLTVRMLAIAYDKNRYVTNVMRDFIDLSKEVFSRGFVPSDFGRGRTF